MKEKVVLKSLHPEVYPDLIIECRVIPNDQIGAYLDTIPDENKFYAHKSGVVLARPGQEGEKVKTVLTTKVNGLEYIISEQDNVVKSREVNGKMLNDIVVTNASSPSNEKYVVKAAKFADTYTPVDSDRIGDIMFVPNYDSRLLTRVEENVIIMTAWGEPALCLAGSYIVTYDAESNDYNTLEKGAYNFTYEPDSGLTLK